MQRCPLGDGPGVALGGAAPMIQSVAERSVRAVRPCPLDGTIGGVRAILLLLGATLLAACGGSSIGDLARGSVDNTDWTLEGSSPDGQHLLVTTLFGGVASGCTRFEGWEVTESVDAVEISAQLWRQRAPSGCTDEGVVEVLQVDLDRPLGDRQLLGCGAEDCRATVIEGGHLFIGQVVAASNTVAVADEWGLHAYTAAGEVVAEAAGAISGKVLSIGNEAVVRNDRSGGVIAVDLSSGEEVWRSTGWIAATGADVVYLCRGQDSDGLTAVDAATGEDLWVTDLACESLVSHGDLLTIVGHDRNVDGGHRLIIVDATTGTPISNEAFQDGYDDQVTGFEGAIAVGSNTIVTGIQANLVVLAEDGTELARQPRGLGHPMGEAEGVAILGAHDRAIGYDVAQQAELWTLDVDAFSTISVAGGSVWLLDRASGTVSRLDHRTGQALWTTAIGATSSFDVTGDSRTAYILTTQALIAVDNASGETRWSDYRPYDLDG